MLLSEALLARGVLVETQGKRIYLTDNIYLGPVRPVEAHEYGRIGWESDADFVAKLLKDAGFEWYFTRLARGKLHELKRSFGDVRFLSFQAQQKNQQHIASLYEEMTEQQRQRAYRLGQPDQEITQAQYQALFAHRHFQSESWMPNSVCVRKNGHAKFLKHPLGPKVALNVLDPYIAMLVKGLNGVGCYTFSACQGSANSILHVEVVDTINAAWAAELLDLARSEGLGVECFTTPNRRLGEHSQDLKEGYWLPRTDRDLSYVRQRAIEFGCWLYNNRFRLREQRAVWGQNFIAQARREHHASKIQRLKVQTMKAHPDEINKVQTLILDAVKSSFAQAHLLTVKHRIAEVYNALVNEGYSLYLRKKIEGFIECPNLETFTAHALESLGFADSPRVFVKRKGSEQLFEVMKLENGNFVKHNFVMPLTRSTPSNA